jgi:23S rRNA (guanosine2251-2'-O)-methyltransferase
MSMREIVLIAHDIRSTHNVGSLLRTAEGLGVSRVYLTGYTPYPKKPNDVRLPHLAEKLDKQIHKTALGAEKLIEVIQSNEVFSVIDKLTELNYDICVLEQSDRSIKINEYKPGKKIAIILGNEVEGVSSDLLLAADHILEIPMFGKKESFNVVQAAAMASFHCRFYDT